VAAVVCLTIAVICAIVARILLVIAAARISVAWAVGVFLPFGPFLFRLKHPEAARSSFLFRLATLGSIFLYVVVGPAASIGSAYRSDDDSEAVQGYASERHNESKEAASGGNRLFQSVEERRTANTREFERLKKWSEALQLQKRELAQTDLEANRAYNIDLEEYQAAFAAATAEKQVLTTSGR
jgi:hypothetical protein